MTPDDKALVLHALGMALREQWGKRIPDGWDVAQGLQDAVIVVSQEEEETE